MTKDLVSVVTPCYNGEKYVGRFLDSLINQTYSPLEIIMINDGSSDRTESIIEDYRSKLECKGISLVYQAQENRGQASALNKGIKYISGEFFICLDSDDAFSPDFIEERVCFLKNNPSFAYCYGKAEVRSEGNPECLLETIGERRKEIPFFEGIIYSKGVFFSGYLIRSEAFDAVVEKREIYAGRGGQNAQILLPMAWNYGEPGYVNNSVYTYYIRSDSHSHSKNTSLKIIRQFANYEKILIETINRLNDVEAHTYIEKVHRYYARIRFGNAIDTMNAQVIKSCYRELTDRSLHDRLLYLKYTNPLIRKILREGEM